MPSDSKHETTMALYLLEVGWELHVPKNTLFKQTTNGMTTTVEQCQLSADTVIELQQTGRLKKKRQFTVNHKKTVVYAIKPGERNAE